MANKTNSTKATTNDITTTNVKKNHLNHLIDFMALAWVEGANPNGDPAEGNRPRTDVDGYGVMSDGCIKRKIRNALQEAGYPIFVQSDNRCTDGYKSLEQRFKSCKYDAKSEDELKDKVCEDWFDVRAFGQTFAFGNTSIGIAGPVTIHAAKSVEPVDIEVMSITKSVNGTDKAGMSSDRMGQKQCVKKGLYVIKGSISPRLAEKTGFSEEDAEALKKAIFEMFDGDESAARPRGSMTLERMYWWDHGCKNGLYPAKKVYNLVKIVPKNEGETMSFEDYDITVGRLDGLKFEEYNLC